MCIKQRISHAVAHLYPFRTHILRKPSVNIAYQHLNFKANIVRTSGFNQKYRVNNIFTRANTRHTRERHFDISLGKIAARKTLLAHLSRRLIGELIVYEGIRRPSVCQHFQTTSPLKP